MRKGAARQSTTPTVPGAARRRRSSASFAGSASLLRGEARDVTLNATGLEAVVLSATMGGEAAMPLRPARTGDVVYAYGGGLCLL